MACYDPYLRFAILLVSLSLPSCASTSLSGSSVCGQYDFLTTTQQWCLEEDAEYSFLTERRKLSDFVFLIEHSDFTNKTNLQYLINGLTDFLKTSQEKKYQNDFQSQYAVIVYSLQKPLTGVYFHDFSPLEDTVEAGEILSSISRVLDQQFGTEHKPVDARVLKYQAAERSLQMVTAVVNKEEITLFDGSMTRLYHRPHADLHIVAVLDLHEISSSKLPKEEVKESIKSLKSSIHNEISSLTDSLHSNANVALHFFINPLNKAATSLLGHPSHSVRYRDCTHFNKAQTLKALITAGKGQSDSLQAHLLAMGVEIQVKSLAELQNESCVVALNPASSGGLGLQPTFSDKCDLSSTHSCSKRSYCSPLHGCIPKQPNATRNTILFEDKAPLTADFSLSHADLATSNQNTAQKLDSPPEYLSITSPPQQGAPMFSLSDVVTGQPDILEWSSHKPFVEEMIRRREAVVLKNTVVDKWSAMTKWNWSYLARNIGYEILPAVKCTNTSLTFDPDTRSPLKLNISVPFTKANMSTTTFFDCIQQTDCSDGYRGHYYFGVLPNSLRPDITPDRFLYNTEKDYEAKKQFMWISSGGMITHGHFDQDFNFFVQLVGEKRFTLWSLSQHELMYIYPQVHPMWHKSRINFRDPDISKFPQFAKSKARQVTLGPGDVMYIPPYTWHYVETLTPSVSLSTWSHDYVLYDHMNSIYRHDHKFDLLEDQRGQMFALRLYLDMMIHDLYGYNETTHFFARLLSNRFTGLEHLFPPNEDDPEICTAAISGKIPTCIHIHGYAKLDMAVVGSHFEALEPEVRDILFHDYVEEITAQVVGVRKMLAFFRYCFLGQEYYITEIGDEEHSLWEHKDIETENY